MSARTKQLAEIAKQGEEGVQKAQSMRGTRLRLYECFSTYWYVCEAVKTAKDEFNALWARLHECY